MIWICRHIQQNKVKAKESGSIKAEVAITIRMIEKTSRKELCQIKEDPHTKATKEVVLEVEEEVVVKSLTIIKKVMQRLQLSKDSEEDDVDPTQYRRLIGS